MKNLSKKVFLSIAVASALSCSAIAEESAGFIGVEVGGSASKQEAKLTLTALNNSQTLKKILMLMVSMSV